MKIYTKSGDSGTTSLVGGTRVTKSNPRIEAYGTIDELMAHVGYLRDTLTDDEIRAQLFEILDRLMTCGALLASEETTLTKLPQIKESDIEYLEQSIDKLLIGAPEIRNFTLPGGDVRVSYTHICRTVCRRAEREIVRMQEAENMTPTVIERYVNRLSDYFYALGRHLTFTLKIQELIWIPRK